MINPIQFISVVGMRTGGRLLRKWATGDTALPEGAVEDGRLVRIERQAMIDFLTSAAIGLTEGVDFRIRDDVTEVELIRRNKGTATLLLPEPDVVQRLEGPVDGEPEITTIAMPAFYATAGIDPDSATGALYELPLAEGDAKFDQFIDQHMAFYCCSQCA